MTSLLKERQESFFFLATKRRWSGGEATAVYWQFQIFSKKAESVRTRLTEEKYTARSKSPQADSGDRVTTDLLERVVMRPQVQLQAANLARSSMLSTDTTGNLRSAPAVSSLLTTMTGSCWWMKERTRGGAECEVRVVWWERETGQAQGRGEQRKGLLPLDPKGASREWRVP
jgi:hypothetical protein